MSTKPTSIKRKKPRKSSAKPTAKSAQETKVRLSGAKPPKPRRAAKSAKTAPVTTDRPAPVTGKSAAPETPVAVGNSSPVELKKRELINRVVSKSGVKKRDAKPVVEAMLEVLGETLGEGREMNLQPLGKIKLNRTKETPSARVIVAKIRQNKPGTKAGVKAQETLVGAAQ